MKQFGYVAMFFIIAAFSVLAPAQASAQAIAPDDKDERMAWFREARFGMFIHFGLYSVAAGQWEGKPVGFVEYFGFRDPAQWEKLLPQFNPTQFDADKIVLAAKDAGMKYLIVTSKHHDGFCLFDSAHTEFDVMSTPFKRDIIRELADACREHGLRFGFYYSIIDLHHPDYLPRPGFDPRPADNADFERYVRFMKAQLKELLTNYGEIDVVWFDGEWESSWTHERAVDMWNFIREIDGDVLINNRIDKGRAGMQGMNTAPHFLGDFGTPEQELLERNPGVDWETCQTMNRHGNWGWRTDEGNFYSKTELMHQVISCASMGGNMLLNIGPKDDGSIAQTQQDRLDAIGQWMRVHGEAIFGSTASPFTRAPAWGRATVKGNVLYCHVMNWPAEGKLTLPRVNESAVEAWAVQADGRIPLKIEGNDVGEIVIDISSVEKDSHATVIAIRFNATPTAPEFRLHADDQGRLTLSATDAAISGSARLNTEQQSISYWTEAETTISWPVALEPGEYQVEVTYGCAEDGGGGTYQVLIGETPITAKSHPTGGWFDRRTDNIGRLTVTQAGEVEVVVSIVDKPGLAVFDFQSVVLQRIDE